MAAWRERFRELWERYTKRQRYAIIGVTVAALLAIFGISFWYGSAPDMVALYTNLEAKDAGDVVNSLRESGVQYRVEEGRRGSTIFVPATQVHDVRLELAAAGLPRGNKGFELFDDSKLGVTEFQNRVNYLQALQGELTRTIEQIDIVQKARVHIVLPEDSLYKKNEKPATASIMLMLAPEQHLTEAEVKGIVNLVSHSIQGLTPENVTLVDEAGNILNEIEDAELIKAQKFNSQAFAQIKIMREMRDNLQQNLQTLLDNSLGAGNAFVRVSLELDFDERKIDRQTFTPVVDEAGIIRSQQDISESYNGTSNTPGGAAGVQGNIPGYVAEDRNANAAYERKESTRNYEINEENQKIVASPGTIRRLTVAVLVSDTINETQQESLLRAVSSAAGINEERGDTISVEALPFNTEAREKQAAEDAAEQERKDRILYMEIAALILLAALILGGFLMYRRKKQQEREAAEEARRKAEEAEKARLEAERRQREEEARQRAAIEAAAIAAAKGEGGEGGEDEDGVILEERKLTLEEKRQRQEKEAILKLIEEKPKDVALLIKNWIAEDE
ncbi:MAG: flagellar M-ring protein FliF [Selenomonadaceae bacterium]|nr:flagellar M-ring protein FliF [Selenomonadaceae bacterium]